MKHVAALEFLPRAPARRLGWLLLALSVPLLAWQLVRYTEAAERRDREAAAFSRSDAAARGVRRSLGEPDVRFVSQATQAASQLAAPWGAMLAMLDEHHSDDVALLRVEPNARTGQLKLVAEARSTSAMVAFLQSLESDRRLNQVTLNSQQLQHQTPGEPVRFTVTSLWLPYAAAVPAQPSSAPRTTAAQTAPGGAS
ncbi:MAG: hypothetical protein KGQ77_00410 [Betaproteobacteria bacterium]|nr:hypothetical protein [Betaproteobacteria bacterium]